MTIFSPDQLTALAAMIPQTLPEGHTSALVGTVDQTGAKVAVGFQKDALGATWQVEGAYEHTWAGDNEVGAKFITSW